MKSKILYNPNRKEMEKAYLRGEPVNRIAKRYGVDSQCLYRHFKTNKSGLSRQMVTAMKMHDSTEASNILNLFTERIEGLIEKLELAVTDTEQTKDYQTMIQATKELRSCFESQVKMLITAGDQGITTENDKLYEEQQSREEYQEMLKLLTTQELKQLEWISHKMRGDAPEGLPDPNKKELLVEDIEPISNTKLRRTKYKPADAVIQPDKTEIVPEQEPKQTIPVRVPDPKETITKSGSRVPRFKLSRRIEEQNRERASIGGGMGGSSIPFSRDEPGEMFDREYSE